MAKYFETAGLLERRIRRGDYTVVGLPTEWQLAAEMNISRRTARRALQQLMDAGLLIRKRYGRAEINRSQGLIAGKMQIAFLSPAYNSPDIEHWRMAVTQAVSKHGATVRSIDFVHWDDPIINQTLSGFEGVFLIPSSESIPPLVQSQLTAAKNLIAVDTDLASIGVPSVQMFPAGFVRSLIDHLYKLGHRKIDCLNTQPSDGVIQQRMAQWSERMSELGIQGRMIDTPVKPYEKPTPKAYGTMKGLIERGEFTATGLVCLTDEAATGAIRALCEHGYKIGKDVSVCTTDTSGLGRYQCPSRTSLDLPDPRPYLAFCLEWLATPNQPWTGPMLMKPSTATLFEGESTGTCRKKTH